MIGVAVVLYVDVVVHVVRVGVACLPAVASLRLVLPDRFAVVLTAFASVTVALLGSCLSTSVACSTLDPVVTSCHERQSSLLRIATLPRLR